jgi:hypothetical protein
MADEEDVRRPLAADDRAHHDGRVPPVSDPVPEARQRHWRSVNDMPDDSTAYRDDHGAPVTHVVYTLVLDNAKLFVIDDRGYSLSDSDTHQRADILGRFRRAIDIELGPDDGLVLRPLDEQYADGPSHDDITAALRLNGLRATFVDKLAHFALIHGDQFSPSVLDAALELHTAIQPRTGEQQ